MLVQSINSKKKLQRSRALYKLNPIHMHFINLYHYDIHAFISEINFLFRNFESVFENSERRIFILCNQKMWVIK